MSGVEELVGGSGPPRRGGRGARRRDHEPQLQGLCRRRHLRAPGRRQGHRAARHRPARRARGVARRGSSRRRAGGGRVHRAGGLPGHALHRGRGRGAGNAAGAGAAPAASRRRCGRFLTAGRRSRRASTLSASSRCTPPRRPRTGSRCWPPSSARRRLGAERARGTVPERPCHNDLLTANFIDDGSRIRIVDWEYAGMGDVYFDLANFAVNNDLSDEETAELPARLLRHGHRRARADADTDALHVRLPRGGDVGRRPAGPLRPRLRLPQLCRPTLRAARAHRRRDRLRRALA